MELWPYKGEQRGGEHSHFCLHGVAIEYWAYSNWDLDGTSAICIRSFMDYTAFTQTTEYRIV